MGKGQHLGEFEQTVMLSVARFEEPAPSRMIYQALVEVTGRDASVASVHVTLTRLEAKGFLDGTFGDGPAGLGKQVKHFALTADGGQALNTSREHWNRLWEGARSHPALGGG